MRSRERQTRAQQVAARYQGAIGDMGSWWLRIAAWRGKGYPAATGQSSIGSSRGTSDPVLEAIVALEVVNPKTGKHEGWREDIAQHALDEVAKDLRLIEEATNRLVRWRAWARELARAPEENPLIFCDNCAERITNIGDDRPRLGLCPRCYKHQSRYGMAWPNRHVVTGKIGPDRDIAC